MSFLSRLKHSLSKTRASIVRAFVSSKWSPEDMERAFIEADFGPRLAHEIVEATQKRLELRVHPSRAEAFAEAQAELECYFRDSDLGVASIPFEKPYGNEPRVLLMVGVNGSGKTTTTAKLAHRIQSQGGKVLLAAADTFRAAAIEQLKTWGQRLKIEVVATQYQADPASVAHDAVQKARSEKFTHLLIDTAGRQHTKFNLMQELQKVKRVTAKVQPGAPHEIWLVVDAPTGGNALSQAKEFHSAMQLTGLVITKLDGSAKGGMVVAIRKETGLPIRYVGLGEGVDELEPFDSQAFSKAILSIEE